jgi:hypothetical protein
MATIEIKTPDGKTLSLNAPDGADQGTIQQMAAAAAKDYASKNQPAPKATNADIANSNAGVVNDTVSMKNLNSIPDRLGSALGVAGQRLTEATGINPMSLVNPGVPAIQNQQTVAQNAVNPGAMGQKMVAGLKEGVTAFDPNGKVAPDVQNASTAGRIAANGVMAAAMPGLAGGGKGTGPVSAAFENPDLVSGSFRSALKQASGNAELAIQQADRASGAVSTGELNRITEMVAARGQKLVKVANEAAGLVENGLTNVPSSKLLLYEDALGKASKAVDSGGVAVRYQGAVKAIRTELATRGPVLDDLLAKKAGAASAYAAEGRGPGNGEKGGLIDAVRNIPNAANTLIDATVGNPALGRLVGAGANVGVNLATRGASALNLALQRLNSLRSNNK